MNNNSAPVDYDPFAGTTYSRVVPTTEPQREIWLADRLSRTASLAYNEAITLRFSGPLNVEALIGALGDLCQRHDALRATISPNGEEMFISAGIDLAVPVIDYTSFDDKTRDAAITADCKRAVETVFDLERGPLFRAEIFRLGVDKHLLLIAAHHIVCDGWSFGVLIHDLRRLYALRTGESGDTLDAPVTFGEYAMAQGVSTGQSESSESYWLSRFSASIPILDLPTDHPRPPRRTFSSRREDRLLAADLLAEIRKVGSRNGAGLFATMLAAFAVLLQRISGSADVVLGVPAAGQSMEGFNGLVGHCVNLLPIRIAVDPRQPMKAIIVAAQKEMLDSYDHQDYTFGTLLKKLTIARDPSRLPLVCTGFNIDQEFNAADIEFPNVRTEFASVPRSYENFEFQVNAVPVNGSLRMECQYNADLFDPETIQRWLECFETLLREMCRRPERPAGELPMISEGDKRLLEDWNNTTAPLSGILLVHELFERHLHRTPDALAVTWQGVEFSYVELDLRATRIADSLHRRGAGRGHLIGICVEAGFDSVAAVLGVMKSGAAYVPLDKSHSAERLAFVAEDADLFLLLVDGELPASLENLRDRSLFLSSIDDGSAVQPAADDLVAIDENDPVYVIYTSGTTGKPKGVRVSHRSVVNNLEAMAREPGFSRGDRCIAIASLSFDMSITELLLPLSVGASIMVAESNDATDAFRLRRLIEERRATALVATPTTWRMLLEAGWQATPEFKAMVGGEALPADLAAALLQFGCEVWNLYGPTEATCCCTASRVVSPESGITIGRPMANVSVWILDDYRQCCPIGVPGEICVGGRGVALGYLNRPALTSDKFVPDPFTDDAGARLYRTGDRGRWRQDGQLEHLGRIDTQIKLRGFRIEPGEIEANLMAHPTVSLAAVIARQFQPNDIRLIAYVAARAGQSVVEAKLEEHLRTTLPDYMVPRHFVVLPALPLLPSGKVDRNALPAADGEARRIKPFVAPRSDLEKTIVIAMEEVLRLPGVGADDDFFALGGHSLLASQFASRISKALGVQLPMRALFEAPTAGSLARWLQSSSGRSIAARSVIPRRSDRSTAPLSLMQHRVWFVEQLDPGRVIYNGPSAFRLFGALDDEALKRAFNEIVRRQDVLRTFIDDTNLPPVQRVLPDLDGELLPREDLRTLPESDRERALLDRLRQLTGEPFDLRKAPLFRARLFQMNEHEHVFYFMPHHIIWDGWSFDLFVQEMGVLYGNFHEKQPPSLPELDTNYGDFSEWHRESMQSAQTKAEIAYWKEQLAGVIEPLALPEDRPRPGVSSGNGKTVWVRIPAAAAGRAREVGLSVNATLFMSTLATYALLLHQVTGQEEIIIGTPVRGRQIEELESVMGFFVNAIPLRIRISEGITFLQLLKEVRDRVLDAFKHPDVPFERLVNELNVPRDRSRSPIYQTMFSFQDARRRLQRWGNLDLEQLLVMQEGVAEDIGLWFLENSDGLVGGLNYSTDFLSEATALRLRDRFVYLMQTAFDKPDTPISALPLPDAERRLLEAWNATALPVDRNALMCSMFESRVHDHPDHVALKFGAETWSYGDLESRANRIAHAVRSFGISRGQRVGLCVERGPLMLAAVLGILKAGAAYVPLDPSFPEERLRFMAEDAQIGLLVSSTTLARAFSIPPEHQLLLDADADALMAHSEQRLSPDAALDARPEDPAYIIYTSGSTGKPKGVVVPHRAAVNFLASMAREPGMDAEDVLLAVTTLSFDIAVLELQLPLALGASVVIASRDEAANGRVLGALLERHGVSVMQATPATWRLLLESEWTGSTRFKALVGGESLPRDLADQLIARGVELWNMYGPTETTVWSTCARITDTANGISIGRPIANTTVWILDARNNPCPIGVPGELCIGGVGVSLGYWNRPELTSDRFIPDPFSTIPGAALYRTGDRARWRNDGSLEHLGRLDFQVKLRGYRIELGEIEANIAKHPAIREVVVVAREDVPGDKRLVAYLVTANATGDLVEVLRAQLRIDIPEYMVPAHFVTLDALPLTPNGKIDRKALPTPLDSGRILGSGGYVAPRNDLEISLATVWQRLLRVERVGINDNFFNLGGNSLLAVHLMLEMEEASGFEIALGEIFRSPTIAGLVEHLGPDASKNASVVVPLQPEGDGIPIFCLVGIDIYRSFAQSLGKDQPVFGVYVAEEQALATQFVSGTAPKVSIERLTEAYCSAIDRFRPQGPYRLVGLSFGGILAMEVAAAMRRRGAEVDVVILLDTLLPHGIHRNWGKWISDRAANIVNGNASATLSHLSNRLVSKLTKRKLAADPHDRHQSNSEATAIKQLAFVQATSGWKADGLQFDFPVLLLRGLDHSSWGSHVEFDPDLGWRRYLGERLQTIDIPGSHLSIMEAPFVTELGRLVRQGLVARSN